MTRQSLSLGEFADKIAATASAVSISCLRGANAALASDPPDVIVARQLIDQALAQLAPEMADAPQERGSFTVKQGGMTVASGTGTYEDVKREAAHYAMMYEQDGPVKVTVRRLPARKALASIQQ
jgi:hypothetical protein